MYYEPYENERPRWWLYAAAGIAAVLVVVGTFALWQVRSGSGSDDDAAVAVDDADATTVPDSTASVDSTAPDTTAGEATPSATTSDTGDDDASATTSTPQAGASDVVAEPVASTAASTPEEPPALDYPTGPDGTPLPLVVVFDTDTITISGQVPTQAARDRLAGLAVANSRFPDAEVIDNMVVNPAVPISVGARVIELNSARFPEGSAEILPEHAAELDRVVNIMQALPKISVLVVGHADQRGDDVANFAISDERARAVVNYLLYLGVAQTRLASRAAGESDLLSLDDDAASLALNRRTEFVFYGLLIE